jgi:pyruvate,water dikinase
VNNNYRINVSNETLIFRLDSPDATLESVGGKGASLARLAIAGLPVPPGFHITTHAYRRFIDENHFTDSIISAARQARADDPATLDNTSGQIQSLITQGVIPNDIALLIRQGYSELGPDDPPVAVRSSATAEDLPEMSFAGQQETYLNVRGSEHVLDAVKRCWASLWTARAIGYRMRNNIPPEDVALAVVVQQLVPADVAGILFTANPVTGVRDQMVINAAWGLGEAIVGGHVTPDTFIVNKQTNVLDSQEIADKEIMTIRSLEGTREEPVPPNKRKQAALTESQAIELSKLGMEIEQLYGQPMDIEWAIQDERFFILQARPITALPEPRVALDWKLPRAKGSYWRVSVIELLPDPLSPLFATLGLPAWNAAMRGLAKPMGLEDVGDLFPEQMLLTINDYAYYDYGFSAKQSARMLMLMPRLTKGLLPTAQKRWAEEARPRYAAIVSTWVARDLRATSAAQLLEGAREIVQVAAEHYLTVQSGIIPIAGGSEWLFTLFYNRLIKRRNEPSALVFMLGFDSAPIQAEKSLYDLAVWARTQPDLANYLKRAKGTEIATAYGSSLKPIDNAENWNEFSRRFGEHLNRFGHAIYDLDFAKSVPANDPAPLLETLKYFLTEQGRNPYERQEETASAREQATRSMLERLRGLRLRWFTRLLRWAQRYAPLREDALADVGLGWPVLRRMLHEIGRRLAEAYSIVEPDDVFWLKVDELKTAANALDANQPLQDFHHAVAERRATSERERMVTPPVNLPLKGGARLWGIDWSQWMPAQTDQAAGDTIKGIGASPGHVEGVARVIHGPEEFNQMQPKDILVAKITTPAWTPLFALASGVVTDVGGLLSHSSIVAREYHIPAVLGTGVATERIHGGQRVTVDGDKGIVTISEPRVTLDWKLPRPQGKYMRANIIELLPDPLSPLFATLGLPAWDEARHTLGKSVGINFADFMPEQLYLTINDYAYLDYGFSTQQSWRYLLFVPRAIKRLLRTAQKRWAEEARPHYAAVVHKWAAQDLSAISSHQLLEGAREIVQVAAEYYLTVQSGILPMSKISESLFPLVYHRFIQRKGDPPALAFMLGFDSAPIRTEKSLYDLAMWARGHAELADYLTHAAGVEVVSAYQSSSTPISDAQSWREFSRRFEEHLNRFGHAIYDLDFAKSVPADDPASLLETLKYFLAGQARSPHERQAETVSEREQATQSLLARLKGFRLRWFTRLLQWVQCYAPLREDALADVGLGWPVLRRMLREIGQRLVDVHAIAKPDEVFWLKADELENAVDALDANQPIQDFRGVVIERRAKWERERMVTPPVNLPIKGDTRFWGIDWSFVMPARTDQAAGKIIKGIGASPGRIAGVARVIHGPDEFNQMQPKDILVAKITTPAWTPLFALASGVVTDVGGILSHSSIVAREYHIPAVLGTGVATERIHSGQRITVDGDGGVVTIER